jgi:hypothetical protein
VLNDAEQRLAYYRQVINAAHRESEPARLRCGDSLCSSDALPEGPSL